jgi:hypothetical protein
MNRKPLKPKSENETIPEYKIENPESEIRSPGQSPEQHEIINESQSEPQASDEFANYTGTYNGTDVKEFNDKLAAITGKRESKGEPASLVAPGEKNYADPYAQNISSLLKRYQEASEAKSAQENKGGAWSMVVGNALGPDAGRQTLQAWQSGADEGVENLDRQQKAATGQLKNEDSLFTLARKARAADPNSPLSKALTDYERKHTGFGEGVDGLSAQDALEAGKGVVTPIYKEQQSTDRNNLDNKTKVEEGTKNREVKVEEGGKNRGAAQKRTETMAKAGVARSALAQDTSSAAGAAKAGQAAGTGAITLPDNLLPLVPGDQNKKQIIPRNSSTDQIKRMREVAEFSSKSLSSLTLLQQALKDPDSNRFERIFEAARSEAMMAAEQWKAGALQGDTKLQDNGVLNPADLTLGNQAIFGMDPASLRSLFKSNPDLANAVQNQINAVRRSFSDSVKVNNYSRGDQAEAMNQAAGNFKSNSQPVYEVDPNMLGEFGIQKTRPGANQSLPQPSQSVAPQPASKLSPEQREAIKNRLRSR